MKFLISIIFAIVLMVGWLSPPSGLIGEDQQSISTELLEPKDVLTAEINQPGHFILTARSEIELNQNILVDVKNIKVVKAEPYFTINKNDLLRKASELYRHSWNIKNSFLREHYRKPVLYPLTV